MTMHLRAYRQRPLQSASPSSPSLTMTLLRAAASVLLLLGIASTVEGLDNGLAQTPPMGWNSWERFRCNLDCADDPENCISELLYSEMAVAMATKGFKEAGYEYIAMDDCWMSTERDDQGRLQPDPKRFPSGMKALADFVHSKGLKLGIYQSMGLFTCEKYPGIWDRIEIDIKTYAEWGIDLVKTDTCWTLGTELMEEGFMNMSRAIVNSPHPILFSCEWPRVEGSPNYTKVAEYCNSFRDTGDVQDDWGAVLHIVDWFAARQEALYKATGPGGYNDADFVIAGDFSLSSTQDRSQFAMWTMITSQLFLSSDLRTLNDEARATVLNKEVIAVNQDKLGKMGQRFYKDSTFEIWKKELVGDAYAVVFFSRSHISPYNHTSTMGEIGFSDAKGYFVRDLFAGKDLGVYKPLSFLSVMVDPSGVVMIKVTPMSSTPKSEFIPPPKLQTNVTKHTELTSLALKHKMGLLMTAAASLVLLLLGIASTAEGLANGLALTPPMGWNSWERFRCNLDCDVDRENCVSELLYAEMAVAMVSKGFKQAGYEYICMDDCWMAPERDAQGRLQADPKRFPSGMKALVDFVHSRGLKFGLYQSMGLHTCQDFPGIWDHIETDVKTYEEWGVDFVKMDTCYNLGREELREGYINMSIALNNSARPILFSCEWAHETKPNFTEIAHYCNTFRDYMDMQDSWTVILTIIDWFGDHQEELYNASGPGSYNDADFIIAGDFSLSVTQAMSQFAMWSMFASQLFLSSDVRQLDEVATAIVLNREVIAVNQDKLGKMGQRIHKESEFEVWTKELADDSYAAVFFSRATDMPRNHTTTMTHLGFPDPIGYSVRDLFAGQDLGFFGPDKSFSAVVNPSGVVMIKATPKKTLVKNGFKNSPEMDINVKKN